MPKKSTKYVIIYDVEAAAGGKQMLRTLSFRSSIMFGRVLTFSRETANVYEKDSPVLAEDFKKAIQMVHGKLPETVGRLISPTRSHGKVFISKVHSPKCPIRVADRKSSLSRDEELNKYLSRMAVLSYRN